MSEVFPRGQSGEQLADRASADGPEGELLRRFVAIDVWLDRLVSAAGQLLLGSAAALAVYQVLTRFLFQAPSDWTEVLVRTLVAWMIYLGIGIAFREGAVVSIDLLRRACIGRSLRWLHGGVAVCTLVFLAAMAWYGAQVTWAVRFQTLAGLDIPISWAYLAVPTGAVLAMMGVLANFLRPIRHELENAV